LLASESHLATGYRHFVSVATLGSVRAASRHLNVAASAISRQIGLLEAQLGISLFERHTRSLALTEAGLELLRGLQAVNQTHEGTLDLLASLKGITRGRVSIAVVESLSISFLPDLLIAFSRKFPGVQAAITVAGSDMVTELVREREADVGVTFNPSVLEGFLWVPPWPRPIPWPNPSHSLWRSAWSTRLRGRRASSAFALFWTGPWGRGLRGTNACLNATHSA